MLFSFSRDSHCTSQLPLKIFIFLGALFSSLAQYTEIFLRGHKTDKLYFSQLS